MFGHQSTFWMLCGFPTFRWREEIEEGIIGDCLCDCPDCATTLMFLFLFDGFQCDVLSLTPVNRAPEHK